jgi:hypothetical protein
MKYVFTHIPKTAGTSLAQALERRFGPEQVRRDNKTPLSDPLVKRKLKALAGSLTYRGFPELMVFGHFLTGKYARFDGRRFVRREDHAYITFLREPLRRSISHYQYWIRADGRGNLAWERMHREKWSLEQFLCSRYFANLQSQFIWGFAPEQFHFIGITEQYARSLAALGARFPLFRELPVLHFNTNPPSEEAVEVSPAVRAQYLALNQRDYEIYNQAVAWLNAY